MLGLNSPRSGRSFATINEAFSESALYWGDHGDWFIVTARTGASDTLDESNFIVLQERLGERALVENASHWACGFVDYLIIAPDDRVAIRIALEAHKATRDYPVLDEDHFSQYEWDQFQKFAESELKEFDGWSDVLHEVIRNGNHSIGDDSSEWEAIEEAREQLQAFAA